MAILGIDVSFWGCILMRYVFTLKNPGTGTIG